MFLRNYVMDTITDCNWVDAQVEESEEVPFDKVCLAWPVIYLIAYGKVSVDEQEYGFLVLF